jgi:hypothetical protein
MKDLILTPFCSQEMQKEYETHSFKERGVNFVILKEANTHRIQSGNYYKFGLVDTHYNFYWFFMGLPCVKGRLKALNVYKKLSEYCEAKEIGTPFAYKVGK